MISSTTIALSKLLAWDGNIRKTESYKALDELAASITAHGLLQSLVVRKDKRSKYAVIAGRRRHLALQSLVANKTIDADMPIPCQLLDDDADATEIGLVENVQREPMHPADEFDAFRALIESSMPAADVAARFLDEVALIQPHDKAVAAEKFQVWKLAVRPNRTATLTCEDGNRKIVFSKEIEYPDLPLDEITFWFTNNAILLPSEY